MKLSHSHMKSNVCWLYLICAVILFCSGDGGGKYNVKYHSIGNHRLLYNSVNNMPNPCIVLLLPGQH